MPFMVHVMAGQLREQDSMKLTKLSEKNKTNKTGGFIWRILLCAMCKSTNLQCHRLLHIMA